MADAGHGDGDQVTDQAAGEATAGGLGYRWPAEWEPHRATWVAWPHEKRDWPGKFAPIPWVFAEVVRQLARGPVSPARPREKVCILVGDKQERRAAERLLERAHAPLDQVEFHVVPTDRVWTRDAGPIFLRGPAASGDSSALACACFRFNGWAKYDNHTLDEMVGKRVAKALGRRRFEPTVSLGGKRRRLVLEGGAIDGNGEGTLLTTEECLLADVQARNPALDRAGYERAFADHLGVRHVIWLGRGIAGDDTHGHVDDLARFVGPTSIVCVREPDESDENHAPLEDNWRRLEQARTPSGAPYSLTALPMPAPLFFDGVRLPASYANFYVGNHAVLVPTFNDPNDRVALAALEPLFPDRVVVGVHALDLVWGLGTLHCMTQQEPLADPAT